MRLKDFFFCGLNEAGPDFWAGPNFKPLNCYSRKKLVESVISEPDLVMKNINFDSELQFSSSSQVWLHFQQKFSFFIKLAVGNIVLNHWQIIIIIHRWFTDNVSSKKSTNNWSKGFVRLNMYNLTNGRLTFDCLIKKSLKNL